MAIFLDPSGYTCLNMGDAAMLLVSLERLRSRSSDVPITVVNTAQEFLATRYRNVTCLHPEHRRAFFRGCLPRRLRRILPRKVCGPLFELEHQCGLRWPEWLSSAIRIKERLRRISNSNPELFVKALRNSSLVVVSGAGMLNDAFRDHAMTVLDTLAIAIRNGIPTVMFGQGIGPMEDRELLERAHQVLPNVDFIALREGRLGPSLLREVGVPPERFLVTGDDAIELAYQHRPERLGSGVGVNVRVAAYSQVGPEALSWLRPAIQGAARALGARLYAVPISLRADDADAEMIYRVLESYNKPPEPGAKLDTPEQVIEQVGRCRVVVAGSYHAAVFALAQGIPAVCISRSPYYDAKFLGLVDQFRAGCIVLRLEEGLARQRLQEAICASWRSAGVLRAQLLEAAAAQIELSRGAYEKFFGQIAPSVGWVRHH